MQIRDQCIIFVTRIWSYSYGICAIKMLIIIINIIIIHYYYNSVFLKIV